MTRTVFDQPEVDPTALSLRQPVRWSNLRHMARSPAHYLHALTTPFEPSAAVRIGALAHKKILRGAGAFAVYRGGSRRGKEWEAFKADHYGVEILTEPEAERVDGVARAVVAHPKAIALLTQGNVEQVHEWEIAGRRCRGTPDCYGPAGQDRKFIADLKVTHDSSPDRFPWHARRMLWHAQGAWYDHGLGGGYDHYIVAVESKPPHIVTVFATMADALEQGEKTWRAAFERLLVCEASGVWPGYTDALVPLNGYDGDDVSVLVGGEEVSL